MQVIDDDNRLDMITARMNNMYNGSV
jgi:hypothetical protein